MLNVFICVAQMPKKTPQLLYILQGLLKLILVAFSHTSSADGKLKARHQ